MELMPRNLSTKERILQEAGHLFGEFGFNGTSIRDIAKKANVNVAAINYHFINKENLFKEIHREAFNNTQKRLGSLATKANWSTEDFSIALFDQLTSEDSSLVTNFKVFLSHTPPKNNHGYLDEVLFDNQFLPGIMAMQQVIAQEIPLGKAEDHAWAAKILLIHIIQTALFFSSKSLALAEEALLTQMANEQESIRRVCRALLKEIKV